MDSMGITGQRNDQKTGFGPARVIFLEDDTELRLALTDYLRLNSIWVTDVASVAEFGKTILKTEFDVALLDVNLPDGSGFEIARQLQSKTNIGVVILTARAGREDRLEGYREGANLYLTKPVDGTELVLAIRNLAWRVRDAGILSVGELVSQPWRLDLIGHRLMAPIGVSIRLSGREAKLLARLALADGAVVSRKDLGDAIGYEELTVMSRRTDAVLRRLRQKAREIKAELPIHAVHAIGFQFSARLAIM